MTSRMPVRWMMALAGALVLFPGVNPPPSGADTPPFPDLSSYSPVDPEDYLVAFDNPGRQPTRTAYFLPPGGVVCVIDDAGAACFGNNLPGVAPVVSAEGRLNFIDTERGLYQSSNPGYVVNNVIHGQLVNTLPPFHSITVEGAACGVDDAGTIACKDAQGRGFVLSPRGSGWFPGRHGHN